VSVLGQRLRVPGGLGLRGLAAVASASMLSGCGLLSGPTTLQQNAPQDMTVTSPDFGTGVPMPHQYTCFGGGESPPVSWSGGPAGTRALALVMDDSGAPITPYVYWVVFNISPDTPDIQAGASIGKLPPGALQADNSKGQVGYDAPCPQHSHQYRLTVYALNAPLPLKNGASLAAAWSAIAAHALGRGRLPVTVNP
jgi:Raf kinase inhibitor-like YbhB/YbcL family protein